MLNITIALARLGLDKLKIIGPLPFLKPMMTVDFSWCPRTVLQDVSDLKF